MISLTNIIKKHTLTLSFLLIIVLFLSFGIFTIKGLYTLSDLTKMIYEHPLVVSNASLNAALNITKMHRSMKDVVLANSPDEIKAALKAVTIINKTKTVHFTFMPTPFELSELLIIINNFADFYNIDFI